MDTRVLKTAVVTGASSGLGRELVRQLVRDRGLRVLATARRADRLDALARELGEDKVLLLSGDLADRVFRARLWNDAVHRLGRVDLLVNNAGAGDYHALADQDLAVIERLVAVNFIALADLTRRALLHMKEQGGGQIVQVSSVLGFMGIPGAGVYAATKHAVNGLTTSIQYELRGTGVRVWATCPGRTQSEFRRVAFGGRANEEDGPQGEPVERVVRAIVKQLDGRAVLHAPTWKSWLIIQVALRAPGLVRWIMGRFAPAAHIHTLAKIGRSNAPGDPP